MWNEIVTHLKKFPTAVLTGIDADGYPFSIRCTPQVDEAGKRLNILRSADVPIQSGPAGLLCHSHNEELWDLKSFLVLGSLEQDEQSWVLTPRRFIPGGGLQGRVAEMKWAFTARANSGKYLKKRSLPRPEVPWDEYKALVAEIKNKEN